MSDTTLTRTARPAPALSTRVQELVNMAVRVGLTPVVSDVDQGGDFDVWLHPAGQPEAANAPFVLVIDVADQDAEPMLIKQTVHGVCVYTWDGFPAIVRRLSEIGWAADPSPVEADDVTAVDDGRDGDFLI